MKFYSDKTHKLYETEEALRKAEEELEKKNAEKESLSAQRKIDAKRVQDSAQKLREAQKEYNESLTNFLNKHGYYHETITSVADDPFDTMFGKLMSYIFR